MSNPYNRDDLHDENGDLHETFSGMDDDDLDNEVGRMNEYGDRLHATSTLIILIISSEQHTVWEI